MAEVTRVINAQITYIDKDVDAETAKDILENESDKAKVAEAIKSLVNADDVVVTMVKDFVRDDVEEKDILSFDFNMTVGDLRRILNKLPNDMDVIIPVISLEDCNIIEAFRHVRTAGILENRYEESPALCLNAAQDGMDISEQVNKMGGATTCKKSLF